MSLSELKNYLIHLVGHVTFEYHGYSCGIDPLTLDSFDMWYGSKDLTAKSVDEVLNNELFDGKSLKDIWDEVTEVNY